MQTSNHFTDVFPVSYQSVNEQISGHYSVNEHAGCHLWRNWHQCCFSQETNGINVVSPRRLLASTSFLPGDQWHQPPFLPGDVVSPRRPLASTPFLPGDRWWMKKGRAHNAGCSQCFQWLIKASRSTWHKIGHFGQVLPSQPPSLVLKKLNLTQQKQTTQEPGIQRVQACIR